MKQPLKHVTIFFVLTFAQTWLFYFAIILFGLNAKEGLGMVFLTCGGVAPSLIGIIMALATYSREEKKEFFRRFYQIKRIGIRWWLFILLIFPVIHTITVLFTLLLGGQTPMMEGMYYIIQNPVSIVPMLLLGFFINGAWPEEWGWRGFALQPLLDRFGFLKANLLLGTIWAMWHLPLFFIPTMQHYQKDFIVGFGFFIAQSIGLCIIMSLVHIKTKQSILSAMLLHMLYNLSLGLMADYSQTYERIWDFLILSAGFVIAIWVMHKKKKAHHRLKSC